ncbi:MAG: hypothetical protein IEMM0006_1952 [bacterium]|nr:MAG: hypothetical protein IEMM0006_1952 [bacterium]
MISLSKNETEQADKLIEAFKKEVPEITAEEVTEVAQKLEDEKVFADAQMHVRIERKVFEIVNSKIPQQNLASFPKGHPIHTFLEENKQIRALVERARQLNEMESGFTGLKTDWTLIAKQFLSLNIHYLRKENQLFPFLEKYGFNHPSSMMWSLHDEIRSLAKTFSKAVEENDEKTAQYILPVLLREAGEMTIKEEKVLLPTSVRLLMEDDWKAIREGEDEIGWMVGKPPASWQVKANMGSYLNASPERTKVILDLITSFFSGKSIPELRERFDVELGGEISAGEFALAEQKIKEKGISGLQLEEKIDELISIFKESLKKVSIDNLKEGHPLDTFIKENEAIKALIAGLRKAGKEVDLKNVDHEFWIESYDKLWQISTHYIRKENQLFPYLEKKGFNTPSTVMWTLDDNIRNEIKYNRSLLDSKKYAELFEVQETLFRAIEEMIFKEDKILWPTSLELIDDDEWAKIRQGEDEVGYCLIEPPPMWNTNQSHSGHQEQSGQEQAVENVNPVSFMAGDKSRSLVGGINLDVGTLTPDQINLIFKHMPFDVTYVNEFDEVRYYNKGDERIFPRSPGIIGRQVKYCHPPKSVHIVEKIIAAFKKGDKNEADFWVNFGGKLIYIQYFAVRDDAGNYKGVLEITYDTTTAKSLEGEKLLLDWE